MCFRTVLKKLNLKTPTALQFRKRSLDRKIEDQFFTTKALILKMMIYYFSNNPCNYVD